MTSQPFLIKLIKRNPCVIAVVEDLMARGVAVESDGAKCVFVEVRPVVTNAVSWLLLRCMLCQWAMSQVRVCGGEPAVFQGEVESACCCDDG